MTFMWERHPTGLAVYEGQFKRGKFQGHGKLQTPTGDVYEGGFENSLYEGEGTLRFEGGLYTGSFKQGHFDGHGQIKVAGGMTLNGVFSRGAPDWTSFFKSA